MTDKKKKNSNKKKNSEPQKPKNAKRSAQSKKTATTEARNKGRFAKGAGSKGGKKPPKGPPKSLKQPGEPPAFHGLGGGTITAEIHKDPSAMDYFKDTIKKDRLKHAQAQQAEKEGYENRQQGPHNLPPRESPLTDAQEAMNAVRPSSRREKAESGTSRNPKAFSADDILRHQVQLTNQFYNSASRHYDPNDRLQLALAQAQARIERDYPGKSINIGVVARHFTGASSVSNDQSDRKATKDETLEKYPPKETKSYPSKRAGDIPTGTKLPKGKLPPKKHEKELQKSSGSKPSRERNAKALDFINKNLESGGMFHGAQGNQNPGAYRKYRKYHDALQAGYSHEAAQDYAMRDERGRTDKAITKQGDDLSPKEKEKGYPKYENTPSKVKDLAKENYESRVRPKVSGRKKKHDDLTPSHKDFEFSVRVPGVDTYKDLRRKFPDWSEQDIAKLQHEQRQYIHQELLAQNERWAHESRTNRLLGKKSSSERIGPQDKVVFFTTSVGHPAFSVPSNSLLGQYVIKRRKKMIVEDRMGTRSDVKGEYPAAVRDQHLIEISTGLSLGVKGRYGLFQNTGVKAGTHRTKGYGRQVPLGTQILRDASGQKVYDDQGNVRYTEGYTRPFSLGTERDVGLRIFIG